MEQLSLVRDPAGGQAPCKGTIQESWTMFPRPLIAITNLAQNAHNILIIHMNYPGTMFAFTRVVPGFGGF
jgi:hypothetical protein